MDKQIDVIGSSGSTTCPFCKEVTSHEKGWVIQMTIAHCMGNTKDAVQKMRAKKQCECVHCHKKFTPVRVFKTKAGAIKVATRIADTLKTLDKIPNDTSFG